MRNIKQMKIKQEAKRMMKKEDQTKPSEQVVQMKMRKQEVQMNIKQKAQTMMKQEDQTKMRKQEVPMKIRK